MNRDVRRTKAASACRGTHTVSAILTVTVMVAALAAGACDEKTAVGSATGSGGAGTGGSGRMGTGGDGATSTGGVPATGTGGTGQGEPGTGGVPGSGSGGAGANGTGGGGPVGTGGSMDGTGGGVGTGGFTPIGGRGGGGPAATGGVPGPVGECMRTEPCPAGCTQLRTACLLPGTGGRSPTANVTVSARVVSAALESGFWPTSCDVVPRVFSTERLRVTLVDDSDQLWELSVSSDLADSEVFAVGQALAIDYRYQMFNIFWIDRTLAVRRGDRLELFFVDVGSLPSSVEIGGSGLAFRDGDMLCPYSAPSIFGCTDARFATIVSDGSAERADPCREMVGDFEMATTSLRAGSAGMRCGIREGTCDDQNVFRAAGVRRR